VSPAALPALMYWWSNAGVEVSEKSEFFYFGPAGTGGGDRHSWPLAEGVDLRWWKNRVNQADMFLLQCQRNAMGFYDHGRRHGVACSGDRFDAPGEKYFTWGTAPHGRAFDLLLSDAGHLPVNVPRSPAVKVDFSLKRGCPRCDGIKLKRHFFSAKRQVEVDQCPNCGGYWLDAGELDKIHEEHTQSVAAETINDAEISMASIRFLYRQRLQERANQ